MAPRIQPRRVSNALLPYITSSQSSSTSSVTSTSLPSHIMSRQFSVTPAPQTKLRRQMFQWLSTEGAALKHHIPGETNYISGRSDRDGDFNDTPRPFPGNRSFISESILSEELRNEIYVRVVEKKKSVRAVSVELGVDMKRIAAVVRLVELERRQRAQGKPLALPYARAVHEMIPTTPLAQEGERPTYHESINDLPAHPSTGAQIFYPVPESRSFNRVDAGRVFSGAPALERDVAAKISHPSDLTDEIVQNPNSVEWVGKGENARQVLQPADVRIPHPQLVQLEMDRKAYPNERRTVTQRHSERLQKQEEAERKRREVAQARREKSVQHVEPENGRFNYRIQDAKFTKETVGADGRAPWAPGRRYGIPADDRKRGMVKIPTRVEA
ncbi:hypothetical protein POX_a00369 [Penicillium oxalicum]|uniref:Eukaryotic mitochondrial regulator protein-domain-containing protein n=1 Tax=Penicillium oxalicum (strain 114-2 / CGMCC 5302) TaxID=933388 RepID=S7ZW41_PENO1|nr:hypothetical protein POX_a00369 [Penicillium oxalicum]EPS34659.1 hypothetical protein PDE_09623 [Penicillium oxalicum 114-2]KAI2793783.1 hypothetical protein POX_a00369 [Penicillium oxalicum]